jgi:hypothetical protein
LLVQSGVVTLGEIEKLYVQAVEEIRGENFRGIEYFLTAWGKRLTRA